MQTGPYYPPLQDFTKPMPIKDSFTEEDRERLKKIEKWIDEQDKKEEPPSPYHYIPYIPYQEIYFYPNDYWPGTRVTWANNIIIDRIDGTGGNPTDNATK